MILRLFILPFFLAFPALCHAERVTVFAAASLQTALDSLASDWADQTGDEIVLVYGGSGALAKQILNGAPADIFISAAPEWMAAVEAAGLVTSKADLLGNSLVLIGPKGTSAPDPVPEIGRGTDIASQLDGGKLAMALVDAVPAGQYGKAALETLGLWDGVAGDVAQADNVRAALALVSSGAAPRGIVYLTDALADAGVVVLGQFPSDSHPRIVYPIGQITDRAITAAAMDYLTGPEAAKTFVTQGFAPLHAP